MITHSFQGHSHGFRDGRADILPFPEIFRISLYLLRDVLRGFGHIHNLHQSRIIEISVRGIVECPVPVLTVSAN